MSKTPLFAIVLATLGLAGAPALAAPATSPAGSQPTTLASPDHGSPPTVLAQAEEKPGTSADQGNESSDDEEK
jgi:hypothetical protein